MEVPVSMPSKSLTGGKVDLSFGGVRVRRESQQRGRFSMPSYILGAGSPIVRKALKKDRANSAHAAGDGRGDRGRRGGECPERGLAHTQLSVAGTVGA